jgi:acyl-CoA thioesterase
MKTPTGVSSVAAAMWDQDAASHGVGLLLKVAQPGYAVVSLVVGPQHVNGLGVTHGGYVFLLADTAMAFASNHSKPGSDAASGSRTEPQPSALAAGASIEFLCGSRVGDTLQATATEVAAAGRTNLWLVEVRLVGGADDGAIVAIFHGRTRSR